MWIDGPSWSDPLQVDDFLVAIGKKKSNSVYHIAEVSRVVPNEETRLTRFHMKVYKSDLLTALKRDEDQKLVPVYWNKRKKKK